jgi:hypothetical protein
MERPLKLVRTVDSPSLTKDTLILVLSFLPFQKRLALRAVSRTWRRFIDESTNQLPESVVLPSNAALVSLRSCSMRVVHSALSLSNCTSSVAVPVIGNWTQLQALTLPASVCRGARKADFALWSKLTRLHSLRLLGAALLELNLPKELSSLTQLQLLHPHMLQKVEGWDKQLALPRRCNRFPLSENPVQSNQPTF